MADQNNSQRSVYPLPPGDAGYDAGYRYEDAAQAAAVAAAQSQDQPISQHQSGYAEEHRSQPPPAPAPVSRGKNGGEIKPRLRKACDSCSVRKVKVGLQLCKLDTKLNS